MKQMTAWKVLRPLGWEDVNVALVWIMVNLKFSWKKKGMTLSSLNELLIPYDFFEDK